MSKLFQDILRQATGLTAEEQLALISQLSQQLASMTTGDLDSKDAATREKDLSSDLLSAFYSLKMRLAE